MGGLVSFMRTSVAWLTAGSIWLVFFAFYLLTLKRLPDRVFVAFARLSGRLTLRIAGVRLELVNANTLDQRRARVVVVNHQSGLDLLWGAAICPPGPLAIGKKELRYIPLVNLMWWALDFILIDRANPQAAVASLQGVADRIRAGARSLIIAPEGTRTKDGTLQPFKKGAFHIAIQAQVPIHPVVVSGAFALCPKGTVLIRPGTIRLRFLEPIETRGLSLADVDSLRARVREAIAAARPEPGPLTSGAGTSSPS